MKGINVKSDWRTVQLFLDDNGISEVEVDASKPGTARCDCRQFKAKTKCDHVKFIKKIMDENDGHYTVHIPVEIEDEEAELAMSDAAAFRHFIIKYGKVEVL